jgi:EAL domain-containing protein (putative c-di-GMP-specific phosphodiesterase class I)
MRRAVANNEFVVYYQPILDVRTGRVIGTEALLRWRHPQLGLLAPSDFIFVAEVTGLIVPLGEWTLRAACAQTRAWQREGHRSLRAAVNLSVRQLQQPDFVARVERVLADTGLPPHCLELEVTESIAMHGAEHGGEATVERLRALHRLGVLISIDDFGTGYSSLSALRIVPADTLKIDRSFVSGVADRRGDDSSAIAAAVIALAHGLNLRVIAEGVETGEQLDFLRGHACDAWQGFLAAAPAPASEMGRLLGGETGPLV